MGEYFRELIIAVMQVYLLNRNDGREKILAKINAMSDLLVDNKSYLMKFSTSGQRIVEEEQRLAKEWKRVGILFQKDSAELAFFCEAKSSYWINPGLYSKRKVQELGISIRNLEEQHRRITEQLL
ncbi:hypothetical protein R3D73_004850 [Serratia marcescens]|uniref:hypothetical protein n=1 Tax=Serratia nevei TaxID=2703794 RepID=UPI001A358262|nr:hypothetical protein [Serratia marcescens]ELQ9441960.1 hypothetical protein [Serratia marcescens]ELT5562486.1 hypothetical protein [Serratia marcescens]HAT4993751.1 hypothetical protein [Serratia marcescens]HCR2977773.1 hypothetical protein [Serratia marcescens]